MTARTLMFQGTGSDVGKSLVVAGLCRVLARRGMKVAPFKAQNMSNNAAVAEDGGEIGRAQWLQALAAGVAPSVHMNPVLLKPESDKKSQVILRGKVTATMGAQEYYSYRKKLLPAVLESYHTLAASNDFILVEGAGSPAEINLREGDIANMGFAREANIPVILIGDIERGGVIASIAGTHLVLADEDKKMIRGFLINKFRGDSALFASGAKAIEGFTGWPYLGLIPYHHELAQLPQEDSLALSNPLSPCGRGPGRGGIYNEESSLRDPLSRRFAPPSPTRGEGITVTVLTTPHLANFDDLDPLAGEENIRLTWLRAGEKIPEDTKLVILAGSKSTIADLEFVRRQGWDRQLQAHAARGGRVLGICGGYQMLGKTLSDPHGVEGEPATVEGLGLLEVNTLFQHKKIVKPWQGEYEGAAISGYEIHCGVSAGADCARPLFSGDGACSPDGKIIGTYVHGLFVDDGFRHALLKELGVTPSDDNYLAKRQRILNDWADVLERSLDLEQLLLRAG